MIFDELTEVLDPEPHSAALNMAIDEILLREATGPILRVYRWVRPAVSFGYFGKFADVEQAWPGREWVRRWTGGGIVPHGNDVTYTVIAPRGCPFLRLSALETYERIHEAIAFALGSVAGGVSLASATGPKVSEACFENAARHDVLAGGKKIAGAAQRRTKHGLLHQGSVQANGENRGSGVPPLNLEATLGSALAPRVCQRFLQAAEVEEAGNLAAQRYSREEWLRRY
jgi:lipoate-protein ligase A